MLVRMILLIVYLLIINILKGQSLTVNYSQSLVEITETHLHPPQTAGADYASSIPLNQGAFVSVQDVRSRATWCLLAYGNPPIQGSATLKIIPDIASVPQRLLAPTPRPSSCCKCSRNRSFRVLDP